MTRLSTYLICASAVLLAGCGDGVTLPEPTVPALPGLVADIRFPESASKRAIVAVVRATESETQVGLMYRKDRLTDEEGMLFAFGRDKDHSFWMENTYLSLDLIFISADGRIVGILAEVPPLTRDSRRVGEPSRFVLEVQAGFAARAGVTTGQRVDIALRAGG